MQLQAHNSNKTRIPIRAVIMVPTYRAAAKFIEKTRDLYPDMIYTSVSFVGSTALANELMLLGQKVCNWSYRDSGCPCGRGPLIVGPRLQSCARQILPWRGAGHVSLKGYVAANVLIAALKQNGPELDTEKLVATFENLRDLDIGLGTWVRSAAPSTRASTRYGAHGSTRPGIINPLTFSRRGCPPLLRL